MCFIDLDMATVWRESERKARKEHKCSCCWGGILIGARYLSRFSVHDGRASSERMCLPCRDAREEFTAAHEHDGAYIPVPSFFSEMLAECIGDGEESEKRWAPMLDAINARGPA